jgi:antitoxin VapB
MGIEYRARIFRNGRSRAVRIPAGIALTADEVIVRQDGTSVVLEPVEKLSTLGELIASWDELPPEDRMGPIEDYPPEPVDIWP